MSRYVDPDPIRSTAYQWGPLEYRQQSIPGGGGFRLLRLAVGAHELELCWSQ